MKMLNMADPGCEVYIQPTGEYIVAASGELHLNHCLNLLREEFAKTEIKVSAPLVSFKETITEELVRVAKGEEEEEVEEWEDEESSEEEGGEGMGMGVGGGVEMDPSKRAELEWRKQMRTKARTYGIDVVGKNTGDRSTLFFVRALPIPEYVPLPPASRPPSSLPSSLQPPRGLCSSSLHPPSHLPPSSHPCPEK
jgi:translation elongation factor EF-G